MDRALLNAPVAAGHPRVMVRPDDLPALRRRAATTHAAQMQSLLSLAAGGAQAGIHEDYSDTVFRLAFLHLLSGDPAHAKIAIDGLRKLLEFEPSGEYFVGARRLKAIAASYDWLHASLDPDLRHETGQIALKYCQALYDSGEVEDGIYLLGHAINQMPFILWTAIGIGDEIDGAKHILVDTLKRWERQSEGYRAFLSGDCFQQSMSYTATYVGEFPLIFNAIEAGLGVEMYKSNAWFANLVKWWTYGMRDDETFVRYGDYFCAVPVLENSQYYRPLAAIASRYRDGLAQWWVDRFHLKADEPDQILFEDRPGVARVSPQTLPRTKYFEPMGLAVARGDFDRGTVATFKCTPIYLHNHGHRDANSFTIYHKGDLAIDSGGYDAYETPQWYNYYIRTIAHNTIVIHDPAEKFISRGKEYSNDGGQRFINKPHFQPKTFEDTRKEVFRDGTIIAYREGDGYSYVCGDASNCYRREKLTKFLRHVTFILDWPSKGSVSLLVLDELQLANASLAPRFLLHTMEEPTVAGNVVTVKRGEGQLTMTTLLPNSPRVEKIGGEGREFEVDGKNYPLNRELNSRYTLGAWRVEVSGGTGEARRFLTLLTPRDEGAPTPPPATLEVSNDGWIVRQGELCVALMRGGKRIDVDARRCVKIELASVKSN